jgi:signal transduction histidine kinase
VTAISLHRARIRLALHYAAALVTVAALAVAAVYLVLSTAVDIETTRHRTTTASTPAGTVDVDEEVTTELRQDVERRVARRTLDRLRTASLMLLAVLSAGSIGVGWVIAGRVLAPIDAALAAQRRFVRDASHELRNPLALMRTSLDLALEDSDTDSTAWREVGTGMRDTVDRMVAVVESLLGTAHGDRPSAHETAINPAQVLRSLAAQAAQAASGRDVTVRVEAEPASIPGDPTAIERALANVVDNALLHAPSGSSVHLRGVVSGETYDIRVEDRGPGIGPEETDAVFERGYRSPDSSGLGLGLAIARDIVDAHAGRIRVERSGPDGTTFLVSLPITSEPGASRWAPQRGDDTGTRAGEGVTDGRDAAL